jgi:ketosteroid isomerase-like protein
MTRMVLNSYCTTQCLKGDLVAVEFEGMGTLKNGTVYNNHYHTLFVMHIREVREYHDSAYANPIWRPIFAETEA